MFQKGGVSLPLKVTACAAGEGVFEESLAVMYTNNGPYYIGFAYADITQRASLGGGVFGKRRLCPRVPPRGGHDCP